MVDSFELTLASVYVCIFPMTAFLLSLVTSPPLFQHARVSRGCFLHRFNEDQLTNLVSGKMLWTPFHSSLKYGMRSHSFNRTSDISTCLLFRLLTTLHEYRDLQPSRAFQLQGAWGTTAALWMCSTASECRRLSYYFQWLSIHDVCLLRDVYSAPKT